MRKMILSSMIFMAACSSASSNTNNVPADTVVQDTAGVAAEKAATDSVKAAAPVEVKADAPKAAK